MPSSARGVAPPRELKKDRLELSVASSAKELIQRAMAVSGLTAGDLAYEGARRVLDEHQRMVLIGADRAAFLAAVLDPPEPADKLLAALRRHRAMVGTAVDISPLDKGHDRKTFSCGESDLDA